MAIRNPFKAKEADRPEHKEPAEAKAPVKKKAAPKKRASLLAERVLRQPHVTEKAVALADRENQYVFQIEPRATKRTVKEAVEQVYGVNVEGVQIVSLPAKRVRFRGRQGRTPGVKKAIVKIQEGQKIEILPV